MLGTERYLSPEQAAAVYNLIGRWQDTQGFYERAAVDTLIREGQFDVAAHVVEVGCGTGALAARLLDDQLSNTADYVALDVSAKMVGLTRERLRRWSGRARVERIDGHSPWPVPDSAADRVVAAYVLDLLAPAAIDAFFAEAARALRPGGMVAAVSLEAATRGIPRLVSTGWTHLWRINPHLSGGCRPVDIASMLPTGWRVNATRSITSWAVTSTVLVIERVEG